ncbi:hypothetical protein GCM10010420_10710 [Streptomyces glaucosporus]|uniref:Secreted protein n=1 Tax=Streptomyces glaucosporus TaxID=284044 RepID=A0ABP5V0A5_9ACTN
MNTSFGVKVLLVIICALSSIIVAIVAGLLSHAPGTPKAPAFLRGGGTFTASMLLCLAVCTAIGLL